MAYIGRDNHITTFTKQSITADGSATVFALDQAVGDATSIIVSIGGVVQEPNVAYTASSSITFSSAPTTAYPIWVVYLGKELSVSISTAREQAVHQLETSGGTTTIGLDYSVTNAESILVSFDGITQVPGTDFTVSGSTLTFTTAPISGIKVLIIYLNQQVAVNTPSNKTVSTASFAASGTMPAWDGSALTGLISQPKIDLLTQNLSTFHFLRTIDHTAIQANMIQGWSDTLTTTDSVASNVSVPLTNFDGINDYLTITDGTLGQSDSKKMLFSAWVEFGRTIADNATDVIMENDSSRYSLHKQGTGKILIKVRNTSGAEIGTVSTNELYDSTDGLIHILVSVDLNSAGSGMQIVVNGTLQAVTTTSTLLDQTIDFTNGSIAVGSNVPGNAPHKGDIGQLWWTHGESLDLSVQANREKFVSGTGASATPVDFGITGATPTGNQPRVFLNNPFGTFQTNLGSGGNFTENGELVDGGYINNYVYNSLTDTVSNSYEMIKKHGKENTSGSINSDQQTSYSATNSHANIITLPNCFVSRVGVLGRKLSSSTGSVTAFISSLASGTIAAGTAKPSDVKLGTAGLEISTLSTSHQVVYFDFPEPIEITAGEYAVGTEYNGIGSHGFQRAVVGTGLNGTSDPDGMHARRLNGTGWVGVGEADHSDYDTFNQIFYVYGTKNLDLITKGSNDLTVTSPSTAPTSGRIQVLVQHQKQKTLTQIAQNLGTVMGNMLFQSPANGPAKAFNGVQFALNGDGVGIANGNFPDVTPNGDFFAGKDWGVGISKTISGVKVWGSNNEGYTGGVGKTSTALLMGSNTQPTQARSGVILGSVFNKLADQNDAHPQEKLSGFDTSTAYRYHWIFLENSGTDAGFFAEIEFYEDIEGVASATLDTDIIGEMSRDGGTTYSPAVLLSSDSGVSGTQYGIVSGDIDFTGDPSGTNMKGRIRTANGDKITVKAIGINWS